MNLFHYKLKLTISGNSSDDKNDFNYQQELSRFLHTGCSKSIGLPNYDCKKTKFDSGNSLLWGISRGDM